MKVRRRSDGKNGQAFLWGKGSTRTRLESLGVAVVEPNEGFGWQILSFRVAAGDWSDGVVKAGDHVPIRMPVHDGDVVLVPEGHGAGVVVFKSTTLQPFVNEWETIEGDLDADEA